MTFSLSLSQQESQFQNKIVLPLQGYIKNCFSENGYFVEAAAEGGGFETIDEFVCTAPDEAAPTADLVAEDIDDWTTVVDADRLLLLFAFDVG